jgi:hypothetical protein
MSCRDSPCFCLPGWHASGAFRYDKTLPVGVFVLQIPVEASMSTNETDRELYRRDFHAWAQQQGALLRRRADGALVNDAALDWPNIAEEIESLARWEASKLSSTIVTIIEHLMKLQASPAVDPRIGWMETIARARGDIDEHFEDNPSLRPKVPEMLARAPKHARRRVLDLLRLHGEQPRLDVNGLAYTAEQVLGDWFPAER